MSDLYEVLDVARGAALDAVKRAYRKAAKKAHPDGGGSVEQFALVKLALDTLTDDERRAHYDRTGETKQTSPDQTETNALQLAMMALEQVVQTITKRGGSIDEYAILDDAAKNLKLAIATMEDTALKFQKEAASVRAFAKKIKPKKGRPDRLGPLLEGKARSMEDSARLTLEPKAAHELAIAILKDHSFNGASGPAYTAGATLSDYMKVAWR